MAVLGPLIGTAISQYLGNLLAKKTTKDAEQLGKDIYNVANPTVPRVNYGGNLYELN